MPKITFEVDLQDGASPALQQIVEQARAAGVEIKGAFNHARPAAEDFNRTVTGTSKIIREDREEHRLRVYAIRGASGALTAVTGEGAAFTRELQQGVSQLFQMDFALKVVADQATRAGGMFTNMGAMIQSAAIPVSVAVGAFLLVKQALDEDEKKAKDFIKSLRDAQAAAGLINADKVRDVGEEFVKADKAARDGHKAIKDFWTMDWSVIWRQTVDGFTFDTTKMAKRYVDNLSTAAKIAHLAILAEIKKENDEELKLDDEITLIKIQRQATRSKNALMATAKDKLIAEEKSAYDALNVEEAAAIRAVQGTEKADAFTIGLKQKYNEKRKQIEEEFTGKFKEEALARKDADDAVDKEVAAKRHLVVEDSLMAFNAETALKKQQLSIDQQIADRAALAIKDQYDAERKKVQVAADIQAQVLAIDEQTALDEERRKDEKFRHLDLVQRRFNLQRELDAQTTQTKLATIDKKEQDAQAKKFDSIEKMSDSVMKSLEMGFGGAMAASIVEAKNFGDAFTGVAKKVIAELITMITTAIIFKAIMGALTGGAGAAIPAGMEEPFSFGALPQYATGGDFIVPPGFERDNYPIRVGSGERVQVTPADKVDQGASGGQTVTINVSTMDAKSFNDFVKQGGIRDALMETMRSTTRTGR